MDLFSNRAVAMEETAFNIQRKVLSFKHKRKTSVLLSAWVFSPPSVAQSLLLNSSAFLYFQLSTIFSLHMDP